MILDLLSNADFYRGLPAGLVEALDFLRGADVMALPLGKTVIDKERLFALVQEYVPKPAAEGRFEAHRRYWDVQYVASGRERMGWNNLSRMTVEEPHSDERDVAFFRGSGDFFSAPAGTFAIFGPQDVHLPGVAFEEPSAGPPAMVRKIVLKVELPPL